MNIGPAPGGRLGKYIFVRELGRGGMGVVYLAQDSQLHRNIALKILSPTLAHEPLFIENFRREAQTLASAYHPNIVHVHSLDTVDGVTFIDMEFVEGGTLSRYLSPVGIPAEPAIRMAADVLAGLDWCHTAGLVHRDVKPSNIIFDRTGRARVADFGLASAYAKLLEHAYMEPLSTGILWGTPRYAPPEAWDGAPPAPAWDVYSTGLVLFEAVSGQFPFDATSPLAALKQMAQGPNPSLLELAPEIPAWFADLIHHMLAPDPSRRPQSAGVVLQHFESSGATPIQPMVELTPTVPHAPSGPRANRRNRSRAYVQAGLVMFVLALVLAALVFQGRLGSPRTPSSNPRPHHPASQRDVFQTQLPHAARIPSLVRNTPPAPRIIYDSTAYPSDDATQERWMTWWPVEGSGHAMIITDHSIAALNLHLLETTIEVSGHWASYLSGDGSQLDAGTVSGEITLLQNDGPMLASLTFISENDGARQDRVTYLSRTEAHVSDTAFLLALEESPLLLPLLYNELLPNDLAWAQTVDDELPALTGSRCIAAYAAEAVAIDAVLDEPVWLRADGSNDAGRVAGRPWNEQAELIVRYTDTALVIAVRAPSCASPDVRLRLTLMSDPSIPIHQTPVYEVNLTPEHPLDLTRTGGSTEAEWSNNATGAMRVDADGLSAELELPFAAIEGGAERSSHTRWRLNAALERNDGSYAEHVAEWGWPETRRVEHGMVISFDAR